MVFKRNAYGIDEVVTASQGSLNIKYKISELLPPTKLCFVEVGASYFSEKSCKIKKVL